MNYEFLLPDIGEGLVEGEIVRWFVKVGDTVAEHQPLAAVLTDKAEVEVPSPKSGKIAKLFGKPGEKIKVHSPLAHIEVSGGAPAPAKAAPAAPAPKAEAPKPAPSAAPKSAGGEFVFNLPDIGEGLVEGELVKWFVKEGASVTEHQPIAAVLTDKAEVEIPSPKTGKIAKLHAKPGEKVKVHGPLVTYSGVAGGASAPSRAAEAAPAERVAAPQARRSSTEVLATPMLRKLAKDMGVDIGLVAGTGPQGRVLEADLRDFRGGSGAPQAAPAAPRGSYDNSRANATPAVKALADSLGVDLSRAKGTGPGGRISELDVRALAPKGTPAPQAAPAASVPAAAASGYAPVSIPRQPGDTTVPFTGIRRKIAEKMQQSRRTVAHVTHMDEVEMTAVMALREKMKKEAEKRKVKLTFLPFIIRALVKSLEAFPMFNSALDEAAGEIVVRSAKNVGIAVAAPQGLLVPNVKGAEKKDVWTLAAEVSALAEQVRAKKIDVASMQGGTVTITNIGPIGGQFATPIVNHPEVAILGLMKLQKRAVVRDGKVVARDMMNLVLSVAHRIVDGADAASFMNTLIKHLENPQTLL